MCPGGRMTRNRSVGMKKIHFETETDGFYGAWWKCKNKSDAALICGMFGRVFLGSGDWLMMYGNTAYHGQVCWLTEGVAQIPAWRNSLSMLVVFPSVLLYGLALFSTAGFVKPEKTGKYAIT